MCGDCALSAHGAAPQTQTRAEAAFGRLRSLKFKSTLFNRQVESIECRWVSRDTKREKKAKLGCAEFSRSARSRLARSTRCSQRMPAFLAAVPKPPASKTVFGAPKARANESSASWPVSSLSQTSAISELAAVCATGAASEHAERPLHGQCQRHGA